jgi:hypothetical protein
MIDYGCFYFAAPKFCSGVWFYEMMEAAGFLMPLANGRIESPFLIESTDKLKVSLVENPIKWLTQCHNAIESRMLYDLLPFTDLPSQSFEGFLRSYVHECPGAVGELFDRYKADSIIRVEDLPWALVDLLSALKVEQSRTNLITTVKRVVVSGNFTHKIDASLRNRVLDAERSLCERYDFV